MTKTLYAGFLSAALALSGFAATPAQANNDDVAKALAAIAAIAIIGAAIDNRNDRRATPPAPRLENLPSECVFEFWGRRGPDHALSARCAEREMRHASRLPAQCQTEVRVMPWQDRDRGRGQARHDRTRAAYDISCLYRAGFRFDR